MFKKSKRFLALALGLSILATSTMLGGCKKDETKPGTPVAGSASQVEVKLMATTDVHTSFVDYNYYTDSADNKVGFVRLASLIKKHQEEMKDNTILVDNGDILQGTPLGDYLAKVKGFKMGDTYPVVALMNSLKYDAATLGNHEFNYGLDFLDAVMAKAEYPYVSANVFRAGSDKKADLTKPYVKPYVIKDKTFKDADGKDVTIKVGFVGFVTPQIMVWDSANLEGKLNTTDIVEEAEKIIPEVRKAGADIVIALAHTGLGSVEPPEIRENMGYQLSQVKGIDAIVSGHSHVAFPGKSYEGMKGVDNKKGLVNGVPYNIAGALGDALGIIDLTLEQADGKWKVADSKSYQEKVFDAEKKEELAKVDPDSLKLFTADHEATLEYIRKPIGETLSPIHSFLALAQDDSSIQLVNQAQKWYVEQVMKGTEREKLPILSAAAPFKAGGRMGSEYYTNIPKGPLAIKNMADLYVYPNTLYVMELKGSEVKEWLEMAAGQFKQIDPAKTEEQELVDNAFATYNFDVIDGVNYKIDVTQPAKYDPKGKLINEGSNRIVDLSFDGKPIDMDAKFLVVTNNYRAGGGGNFPGLGLDKSVYASPDETRQVIVNYITNSKQVDPKADNNWSFKPIGADAKVVLLSSKQASTFIGEDYTALGDAKDGYVKYLVKAFNK